MISPFIPNRDRLRDAGSGTHAPTAPTRELTPRDSRVTGGHKQTFAIKAKTGALAALLCRIDSYMREWQELLRECHKETGKSYPILPISCPSPALSRSGHKGPDSPAGGLRL